MSIKRRTKMISLRLSESEFEELKARSEAHGARSLSDYARSALNAMLNEPDDRFEVGIQRLSREIQELTGDVRRLTELLEDTRRSFPAPATPSRHKSDFGNAQGS